MSEARCASTTYHKECGLLSEDSGDAMTETDGSMSATTTTISDFLLARIAEDEADVLDSRLFTVHRVEDPEGKYWWECDECGGGGHSALSDAPEWLEHGRSKGHPRVLAECEAKRQIAGMHETRAVMYDYDVAHSGFGCLECGELGDEFDACPTTRTLAAVYADHPDYQQEWRL